ncbi:MAG: DUF3536 domain-containing protein [Nanoarchaeota archaeon]|nr:DUF3536 domain-containing protein [Nanoarchaeota archaeon]MCG2717765.1 DUF3536 domain-containing protein [Nanoarchaeota archaeon]
MPKYVLQHWHFYQPRRNDKWAKKINEECYSPNSNNGILDHVSFNVGPTLIEWFLKNDKETLERMIKADKGQALAQPYNHRIMPLIRHDEDLKTQIIWGKKHFKTFFGRDPEGMWLPETATSKRVCKELARQGIKYTIGSPWQKKGREDTSKPYKVNLGGGLEIIYFFYNHFSGKIAFNNQTDSGVRLLDNVDVALDQLVSFAKNGETLLLAYDGETFGHHHKLADRWAEYFPKGVKKRKDIKMISISDYLKNFEVNNLADILDNSSWSCLCGGLERWTKGCGCAGGYKKYQEPMLKALEKIEDEIHDIFVNESSPYFKDVWDARNDYIDLKLGNIKEEQFFKEHLKEATSKENEFLLKKILEAEYHVQLSFTSCGWFPSRLGAQAEQNMIDAYSSAKLVEEVVNKNLVSKLISDLDLVEDWIEERGRKKHITGKELLLKHIT